MGDFGVHPDQVTLSDRKKTVGSLLISVHGGFPANAKKTLSTVQGLQDLLTRAGVPIQVAGIESTQTDLRFSTMFELDAGQRSLIQQQLATSLGLPVNQVQVTRTCKSSCKDGCWSPNQLPGICVTAAAFPSLNPPPSSALCASVHGLWCPACAQPVSPPTGPEWVDVDVTAATQDVFFPATAKGHCMGQSGHLASLSLPFLHQGDGAWLTYDAAVQVAAAVCRELDSCIGFDAQDVDNSAHSPFIYASRGENLIHELQAKGCTLTKQANDSEEVFCPMAQALMNLPLPHGLYDFVGSSGGTTYNWLYADSRVSGNRCALDEDCTIQSVQTGNTQHQCFVKGLPC